MRSTGLSRVQYFVSKVHLLYIIEVIGVTNVGPGCKCPLLNLEIPKTRVSLGF